MKVQQYLRPARLCRTDFAIYSSPATESPSCGVWLGMQGALQTLRQKMERQMRFTTPKTLTALTLAALASATLSTAVMAQDATPSAPPAPFDFAAMDADKDGQITKAEAEAFRTAQITAMDTDKDGKISAAELAAAHVARASADLAERADNRAKHMIVDLDSDGDGALTVEEMMAGGRGDKMFDRVDADNDGAISQAEADDAQAKMAERGDKHGGGHGGGHGGKGGRDGGGKGGFGGFW